MATEVAQLIFKADTSQLKSAEKQVDSLGAKTQKTSNNTQAFGRKAGMASIQVEQLVGQIAGGQNPMRAFGVQAADLGFVLGVPLLGSVVAVSAAFLSMIPSLASAEDESKTLADEVKSLTVNLNELTDAQRAAVAIQFTKEIQQLNKQISGTGGLNTYLGIATEKVERLEATMAGGNFVLPNGARVSQEEFEKVLNKSREEVTNLQAQIDGNNISIKNMQGILDGTVGSTQDYIDSLREESIVLGMSARQKALYTAQTQGATAAQLAEINATFDLIDAKNAAILAQKQEEDAQKRAAQTAATKAAADKRAADAAARRFASQSAAASEHAQNLALLQLDQQAREKQQHDNAVAALKNQKDQQLITEQEYSDAVAGLVAERERRTQEAQKRTAESDAAYRQRRLDDAWREHYESMDMLDRYAYHFEENMITMRDVGAAAMMTFENAVGNAFEQFVTGQINAEQALQMVTRSILSGVINAIGQMAAQYIISQLAIESFTRTTAIAAAMGQTFQAQSMVLQAGLNAYASTAAIPVVGPALAPAAMATAIAATQPLATASGALAMTGATVGGRALGGQVLAGESYVVGERGPEVLTMGGSNGRIITNEALRGNNQSNNETNVSNVSFNITANDSRGFDELLQSRRGTIVSMINKAMANKGKRAIV